MNWGLAYAILASYCGWHDRIGNDNWVEDCRQHCLGLVEKAHEDHQDGPTRQNLAALEEGLHFVAIHWGWPRIFEGPNHPMDQVFDMTIKQRIIPERWEYEGG